MANPVWFIEEQYLRSKLAQLVESGETRFNSTAAVKQAIEEAGFTVFGHFTSFSLVEGTSPNQYFDAAEYLVAKANQLNSQPGETTVWTADTVRQAIKDAGFATVYDHFTQCGWKENVNPSSEFDVSSYFDSKLAQLQRTDPAGNWTVDKIKAAFNNAELDPIEHYLLYGRSEGIDYTSNEAPQVADNVSVTGFEDESIDGVVSATDADGDSVTFKLVDGPAHGSLVFNTNGTYTYTPDANYNGTDSFSYKANDGLLDSVAATVTIDVKNVEDSLTTGLDNVNLSYSVPTDDVITGSVSSQALASTYNPGDRIDGGAGNNTLRLSMDAGVIADSVEVSNMQTLDLRLNASINPVDPAVLVMTDWDDSLEQINIKSNKSELYIVDQQTVADISIVDKSTLISDAAGYGFNYAAGVLDGDADTLNLSINNVNGVDGADIFIDQGMEAVAFNVADRVGDQYASNIDLEAQGATDLSVAGGLADQAFILDANVASGANFDSTAFAGDMVLASSDIATAAFGAGSDDVTLNGQADGEDSSYDLGEGNNTLTVSTDLAGSIVAGSGDDTVEVHHDSDFNPSVLATGSIDLGNGDNDVHVDGDVLGQITVGSGDDHVEVGDNVTGAVASIDLGDGDNRLDVAYDVDGDAAITFGTGTGTLNIGDDIGDSASVTFAGGDNTVNVTDDIKDNASVTFADGNDALLIGGEIGFDTAATVSIDFAGGNNRLVVEGDIDDSVAHSTAISFGDGDNSAWIKGEYGVLQSGEGTTSITFGNGNNELLVGFERDEEGELVGTNGEYGEIIGATVEFGDGTNYVAVADDVDNAHIHFGNGDGNSLNIGGSLIADQPGTIIFGDGAGNSLNVYNNINNEHVVFGDGAGNSLQADWLTGAVIEFGDGGANELNTGGLSHSQVTFGSGDDSIDAEWGLYSSEVNMGAGNDTLAMSGDAWVGNDGVYGPDESYLNQATKVDMGAGDDQVRMMSEGDGEDAIVYSGGFIEGGEGNDTLTLEAQDSMKLIGRDLEQQVSIDLLQNSYTVGQEVTVTFTRGDEEFSVSYKVVLGDIVQGNSASTSANVAAKLAAALNADDTFPGYFDVSREAAELTITSDEYLVDFDITSSVGTVTVEQISDAHIGGIENLELVALNGETAQSTTISADFNLIDGVETILLDSQEEAQTNPGYASGNGYYETTTAGGVTTFELIDLKGGESITVSGFEASATGNFQVERITVGVVDGDHQIGDKIVVTFGATEITYVVTEADLNGAEAGVDADQIAIALAAAITDAAEAAGFSVAVDNNQITLVGSSEEHVDFNVDHLRTQTDTLVNGFPLENPGSWDALSQIELIEAGDVITLVVDGEEFSYTVTEQDCLRDQAEAVTAAFAELLTDAGIEGVTAAFGRLIFANDTDATVSVTREVDVHANKTGSYPWQDATGSDDASADVTIDANLGADASDTTMDLTLAGEGSFDLRLSNEDSGYTDLDLKLGDEYSHTVYTNGYQFGETITVSDVDGVNTAGQTVVLEAVLAHDVTSTSEANLVIDQYSVRANEVNQIPADNDFDGETITVSTGSGDDHLITAAQSALNGSIDLGEGENRLSLGWGNGVTLDSADLEAVGDITYSGNLTQLDILNDVVLDQAVTTLTLPGDDLVEVVRFDSVSSATGERTDLTVVGVTNDLQVETAGDFDLGYSYGDVSNIRANATVLPAGIVEVRGQIFGEADLATGADLYKFTHTGGWLTIEAWGRSDGSDTNLMLFNAQGQALEGDDDNNMGGVEINNADSQIRLNLPAGDYYIAIGDNDISAYTSQSAFEDTNAFYDNGSAQNDPLTGISDVMEVVGWEDGPYSDGGQYSYTLWFSTPTGGEVAADASLINEAGMVRAGAGVFTATNALGEEITGNLTITTDDDEDGDVEFNLGNHALDSVVVIADEEINLHISNKTDETFNIGAVELESEDDDAQLLVQDNLNSSVTIGSYTVNSTGDSDLEVNENQSSSVTIGDVTLVADVDAEADVFVEDNIDSTITLGNVRIETTDFDTSDDDSSLDFSGNESTTLTVESLQIVSDYDVQLDIDSNSDSEVTITGDITLESNGDSESDADAFLDITDNDHTNVSLAVDGTVSLASCEESAEVDISGNRNNHQPGDSSDLDDYTTYTVELGDLVLDAGADAYFEIDNNDDDTFFGDLVIKTGDIEMSAYDQARLVIGEDWLTVYGEGNEAVTVELGAVNLTAQVDAILDLRSNDGRVYDLGATFPDVSRYQQDLAVVTVGDLTADAGDDAMVNIDYNDLANIQFGMIDLQAADYAELCVDDNSRSNFTAAGVSLAADGYSYFSFYSNASSWDSLAGIPSGRDFITGPELYLIDGDLTVDGYYGSMVDLSQNDGEDGSEDRNLAITVAGDTTVSSEFGDGNAVLEIAENDSIEVSLQGKVTISSGEYADLDIYDNDNIAVTIDDDVSVTSDDDYAAIYVSNTNSSEVELKGQTSVYAYYDATLKLFNNDNSSVKLVDQTPAELLEGEDVPADISLTSTYEDVYLNVEGNYFSNIELGKLSLDAYDDASINVGANDYDSWITVGDVDVTAGDVIDFEIDGNNGFDYFSLVQIGAVKEEDYWVDGVSERGTITLSGDSVGSYDNDSGVYVDAGDEALVVLGDFDITASDELLEGGNDVDLYIHTSNDDSYIDVGDITIDAENDVYFYAADHGDDSRLSMGDITITAGSDAALGDAVNVSSDLFFFAEEFIGTETIELTANSKGTGVGNVYADIENAWDLESLTVSGTSAEIYFDGPIGYYGTAEFTLDLSGLTGEFSDGAEEYVPLGDGGSNNRDQSDGSYVSTWSGQFEGADAINVAIGSGDLIYNAQHSAFGGDGEDFEVYPWDNGNAGFYDWNGDEGWFSLGGNLDLAPTVAEQTFALTGKDGSYGYDAETNVTHSLVLETGERAFAVLRDYWHDNSGEDVGWYSTAGLDWYELVGSTWVSRSESDVEDAIGADISVYNPTVNQATGFLDTTLTFTGRSDGSDFDYVEFAARDVGDGADRFYEAMTGLGSSASFDTTYGKLATDGNGNQASETFEFVGDTIGEVVIGGFRPNGFFEQSQVDRLDLSAFADSAADLIISIDDNDGYFADVVIEFVDQTQGSIRLVGVGEHFTDANVNGIANSISFA